MYKFLLIQLFSQIRKPPIFPQIIPVISQGIDWF